MDEHILDAKPDWKLVAAVAEGAAFILSNEAWQRIEHANHIVDAIVKNGVRAYGVNTGVGALSDTIVDRSLQGQLSYNILLSHACGVGPLLARREVRAIIAAQIVNFSHGYSGVRREIVEAYLQFLAGNCVPDVPSKGSVGYLTHNAHIAAVLIGKGKASVAGRSLQGKAVLEALGLQPLSLKAKEGLSLVNGTACATGLACVAIGRTARLLDWPTQLQPSRWKRWDAR